AHYCTFYLRPCTRHTGSLRPSYAPQSPPWSLSFLQGTFPLASDIPFRLRQGASRGRLRSASASSFLAFPLRSRHKGSPSCTGAFCSRPLFLCGLGGFLGSVFHMRTCLRP